jgi:hypothetical protein
MITEFFLFFGGFGVGYAAAVLIDFWVRGWN